MREQFAAQTSFIRSCNKQVLLFKKILNTIISQEK